MTKEEIIRRLKYTMKKHKNDTVHTFDTNISVMCKDILDYLEQEPNIGYWKQISPARIYECDICGQNVMTDDISAYRYCHGCGAKMVEPQKSEEQHEKTKDIDRKECKYHLGQIITMGKNKKEYEVIYISSEPWIEFDDGSMHYELTIRALGGTKDDDIFLNDAQID